MTESTPNTSPGEPLCWPIEMNCATSTTLFFADFPLLGLYARARRQLARKLKARKLSDLNSWGDNPRVLRLVYYVSMVINETMRWLNPVFLPNDPVAILLWDPSNDMASIEVMKQLTDRLSLPANTFDDIKNLTLSQLIETACFSIT